jgi:ATP-binding protein involved in chromosome partitioning
LAESFDVPFLGEIPIIQSIAEAGDNGKPVALNQNPQLDVIFGDIASKIAQQISISNAQMANC